MDSGDYGNILTALAAAAASTAVVDAAAAATIDAAAATKASISAAVASTEAMKKICNEVGAVLAIGNIKTYCRWLNMICSKKQRE
jgi:hypothetical protein